LLKLKFNWLITTTTIIIIIYMEVNNVPFIFITRNNPHTLKNNRYESRVYKSLESRTSGF